MPAQTFIDKPQTQAVGTNWTALVDRNCDLVRIHNNSGASIDVRVNGGGNEVTIPNGTTRTFYGVKNANELSVRRTDTAATQVYVQAEIVLVGP